MPAVLTLTNAQVATAVDDWLTSLGHLGTRVAVIEGLPGSGKSTVAEELKRRTPSYFVVELDDFLPERDRNDRTWRDHVSPRGHAAISDYSSERLTLVEGAAAWPVVRTWAAINGHLAAIPRAYLKRVTQQGAATFWDDGDGLAAHAAQHRSAMMASIYAYHADERPWETADVVFERVDD